MKKFPLISIFLLSALAVSALEIPQYGGIEAGYSLWAEFWNPNPLNTAPGLTLFQNYIKAGFFFDFYYGDIRLAYKRSIGDILGISSGGPNSLAYSYNYIEFVLSAKYPLPLGSLTVFPKLGLKYDFYLTGETQIGAIGLSVSDFNHLFVSAGIEFQVKLSNNFMITIPILFDFCVNPEPQEMMYTNIKNNILSFSPSVGIGYGF